MKLIIGLGNPGSDYAHTRHNLGFVVVSDYAAAHGATFQPKPKFKAEIAELQHGSQKIILAKPTTYYNLSGEAVRAISDFYKITPADILIVHDELDLPFGTIRTRIGGGSAGNNGVANVTEHLGADTARLRIGSSNEHHRQTDGRTFVLGKLAAHEAEQFTEIAHAARRHIDSFIEGTFGAHSEHIAP